MFSLIMSVSDGDFRSFSQELLREIESVRSELNESFLQNDEFEEYYRKSTELDKLIEEYLERKQQVQMS